MKQNILFSAIALMAGSLIAADSDSKDAVKTAVRKLTEAGSYGWKTTVENAGGRGGGGGGQFRAGPTVGKIGKDGVAVITITRGENTTDVVIKGDKRVVKTQEGWKTTEELAAGGGGGGGGGRGGFRGGNLRNIRSPAAEAEDLIGKVKSLQSADGAHAGDLTEEGAKSLLTFGGGRAGAGGNTREISGAKGSVKFWVKDGVLSKYELRVQGKVSFNGNDRDIDRTTTVEIKDVGSTKIEVPEEAAKKLS